MTDRCVVRLEGSDKILQSCRFRPCELDVKLINVELRGVVGHFGGLKGDGDERFPERIEKDVLSKSSVVIERLVNDIPGEATRY